MDLRAAMALLTCWFTAATAFKAAGQPVGLWAVPDDPAGRAMTHVAQQIISAYHAGQPRAKHALRVVYFVPKDCDPLPNYAERLDRVMSDVSDFYRDGLRRLGIETFGLPLERKDGRLVVHLLQGQLPARKYSYESGDVTAKEIRLAFEKTMDVEGEQFMVFYALCRKESDGRYVFASPYYGEGSQRGGMCHAADCELLDPLLLTETNRPIVFTEHYYPRVETTVARFNSSISGARLTNSAMRSVCRTMVAGNLKSRSVFH